MLHGSPTLLGCLALAVALGASPVRAQGAVPPDAAEPAASVESPSEPAQPGGAQGSVLASELQALADARLLHVSDANEDELLALVQRGEQLHFAGQHGDAAVVLLEALESPRFADFRDFPSYAAAEHAAATALAEVGSLMTARRYLEQAIARGKSSPFYGPAVRAYVDGALSLGDAAPAAAFFDAHPPQTPDAQDELRYLRARARYDAGEHGEAAPGLTQVSERSRFYASAQYLLGAIAADQKKYRDAEQRFCAVTGKSSAKQSLYVDARYYEVLDLARLGLGRVAHEQRRGDDAFYYYFQVPRDSARMQEGLFEGAYASYEGGAQDVAVDLLDQLEAHFPSSSYADEAAVLRGYVALARCEFDEADGHFERVLRVYGPLLHDVDRALGNPGRRRELDDDWRAARRGAAHTAKARKLLLSLLRDDPELERMRHKLAQLDAEASRGGRVALELEVVRARVLGGDRPRPVDEVKSEDVEEAERITAEIDVARQFASGLAGELDALRAARAPYAETHPIERALSDVARRLARIEDRAARLRMAAAGPKHEQPVEGVARALDEDLRAARALPERVRRVREQLAAAIDARVETNLRALRERVHAMVQRARIGRIDAVMGSKRRIERQIESLAAGRFPPELRDPLLVQRLLADDEEYWPFESEDWPDEYEERYGEPGDEAQ